MSELGRTESLTSRLAPKLRSRLDTVAHKNRVHVSELVDRALEVVLTPQRPASQGAADYAALRDVRRPKHIVLRYYYRSTIR
jgi:hypothetical protein